MSRNAILEMKSFYSGLVELYGRFDINVESDIGRRNMLMSSLQEKTFAKQIKAVYPSALSDGKTGEPDIIIPEIERELECKLTSRNKSGSWSLQTDYNTLQNKGKLDYLYVLASREFDSFAVLFFHDLTTDDFFPPSPGSKGKSRMKVAKAMEKCTIVYGDVVDNAKVYLKNAQITLLNKDITPAMRKKLKKTVTHWQNTSNISFVLEAA
tara:strand:+ start:60 stop:689 length:630 start_codon:yes stop_codon:yes gene_type:complete